MRIDFGNTREDSRAPQSDYERGYDADDFDDIAGGDPYAEMQALKAARRQRRRDFAAGTVLAAATVAVLVNVFAFQHGNKPNFMFGFALPDTIRTRLALDPVEPAAPKPAPNAPQPSAAMTAPAPLASVAPQPAPAPAAPAGPPTSLTALINGTAPAPARQPQPVVADVQRELARRGYYDGPADGLTGPKTEAAVRAFEQSARVRVTGEANEATLNQIRRSTVNAGAGGMLPPASVPGGGDVTGAIRPPGNMPSSSRVLGVQRTLAKLGYGPLKVTGQMSPETRQAVQRFERDRGLPVDGELSDRMVRELATVSGMAID
ncbi:peptidoglycan-binding protein [Azorhizobium oxalatiphilum]|uniref:Peptidoglycan-binding protein n=1 Tax=Azorhizobium oxalatiphilum TaxID=980631 RepID=A0A917F8B5_9HYPH|nr:peptidoglycan-binding protein [Azorhizobium oxalatiphilum]GGF52906.1 peptidoglycan-binding protein [Azorhizobium oxalatiphilum]